MKTYEWQTEEGSEMPENEEERFILSKEEITRTDHRVFTLKNKKEELEVKKQQLKSLQADIKAIEAEIAEIKKALKIKDEVKIK